MLPTCVLNFRCIVGVEHFQKILVFKKKSKTLPLLFIFFNQSNFNFNFKFQYKCHLGGKVSTMADHDHFVKLYGGLLLLVKLSGTLLL
jgi:hypothetical protein